MSYWDPSLVRIARLETKVQGKKFGDNQTLFLFIAMRNSNTCIDADETMPRVSFLTQASDAQDQLRGLLFRWTDMLAQDKTEFLATFVVGQRRNDIQLLPVGGCA
jgi:hypothetical protein